MVAFILVPKNSGLARYNKIALNCIKNIDSAELLKVRGEDIPFWMFELKKKGKRVLGLTGEDLYKEFCLSENKFSKNMRVLRKIVWFDEKALFKKPTLCLLGPVDQGLSSFEKNITVCISEKYKNIANEYLNRLEIENNFNFRKVYITGSCENSYSEGISDLIIDIVYTGSSIEKYGLSVYEKIISSDFLILSNDDDCEGGGGGVKE